MLVKHITKNILLIWLVLLSGPAFCQNEHLTFIKTYFPDKLAGQLETYYASGKLSSIENYSNLSKGIFSGKRTYWFDNGQLKMDENYVHGKLHGELKHFYPNGILKRYAIYDHGTVNSQSCQDSLGRSVECKPIVLSPPSFPGGDQALTDFVHNNLKHRSKLQYALRIELKQEIEFTVERDGSISHIGVLKRQGNRLFIEEAIRVIGLARFNPALEDGYPVRYTVRLPLTF